MNATDIPIEQLKSWLKDVKRISHEQRANEVAPKWVVRLQLCRMV